MGKPLVKEVKEKNPTKQESGRMSRTKFSFFSFVDLGQHYVELNLDSSKGKIAYEIPFPTYSGVKYEDHTLDEVYRVIRTFKSGKRVLRIVNSDELRAVRSAILTGFMQQRNVVYIPSEEETDPFYRAQQDELDGNNVNSNVARNLVHKLEGELDLDHIPPAPDETPDFSEELDQEDR